MWLVETSPPRLTGQPRAKVTLYDSYNLTHRHQCIDEILNREFVMHEQEGGGVHAMDEDEDLESRTVKELTSIAKARNIVIRSGARKATIVALLRESKAPEQPTTLALAYTDATVQGFNPDTITPYFHTLAAHVCEQMIVLASLGKFIKHPITHKHCSCSPCELNNNRYNRTYFQRCSRRPVGLERETLLLAWRCTFNKETIDRSLVTCPHCGKTYRRAGMLKKHINNVHAK